FCGARRQESFVAGVRERSRTRKRGQENEACPRTYCGGGRKRPRHRTCLVPNCCGRSTSSNGGSNASWKTRRLTARMEEGCWTDDGFFAAAWDLGTRRFNPPTTSTRNSKREAGVLPLWLKTSSLLEEKRRGGLRALGLLLRLG